MTDYTCAHDIGSYGKTGTVRHIEIKYEDPTAKWVLVSRELLDDIVADFNARQAQQ